MEKEKYKEEGDVSEKIATLKQIVVYNDDVNSFEHVITCFIHILEIETEQAVRYTFTVDRVGKCAVKEGTYKELEPYALKLLDQGLSCKIE